jgi:chromosome segregation ATPase
MLPVEDQSLPPLLGAKAIIAQPIDETVARMEKTVEAVRAANQSLNERLHALQRECGEARTERDHATDANKMLRDASKDFTEHNKRLVEQNRALEADLAKVREHIGSKAYNEIVGK